MCQPSTSTLCDTVTWDWCSACPVGHVDTVERADLVPVPLHVVIPLKIASESERIVVVGLLRARRGMTKGWTGLVEAQRLRRRQKHRGVDTTIAALRPLHSVPVMVASCFAAGWEARPRRQSRSGALHLDRARDSDLLGLEGNRCTMKNTSHTCCETHRMCFQCGCVQNVTVVVLCLPSLLLQPFKLRQRSLRLQFASRKKSV